MSEFLFTHSRVQPRVLRLRLAVLGVVGAILLGGVVGVLGLQTLGVLSSDVRATVHLPTVGDTLGINSDVKYHGLRVGRVVTVDAATRTAEVLVEPQHADLIPAAVHARVLPGTLFGNEYVDLVRPAAGGARGVALTSAHLTAGADIPADTSTATLRLMDTFSATQRLLSAVDPAQWDLALSQIAAALDGRGSRIAQLVREGNAMLGRWEELHPLVQHDIDLLTSTSDLASDVEPQLLSAVRDTRPVAQTLVDHEQELRGLLAGVSDLLGGPEGVTAFLRAYGEPTARLLNATAANLEVFARRSPAFALILQRVPVLLRNGANAVKNDHIQMDAVIGTDTLKPYDAADCPTYVDLSGPCRGGTP